MVLQLGSGLFKLMNEVEEFRVRVRVRVRKVNEGGQNTPNVIDRREPQPEPNPYLGILGLAFLEGPFSAG